MSTTPTTIEIFDTTLRDGLQVEGVTATVEDKLRIAEQLDVLGVNFIEGGWPGANPKDIEFFARAATELDLDTSTLVAFGSTRRPRGKVDSDDTLRNLVEAATPAVCIVAKSSAYHVTEALQTTLDEGEAMIADSVRFLRDAGRLVLVDMEHFFDGYKADPEFSLRALEAAVVSGASHVVLCDTNGGSLPDEVGRHRRRRRRHVGTDVTVGIHCHDDTGCAVANSMAAVAGGRRPRPGHAQRPRRAHRQRQPHDDHPQPRAQARLPLPARRPPGAADEREPPRRRAAQPGHQPAGARTSARAPSPTRPGCTSAPSPGPRTPTSTSTRRRSATAPASSCREMAGRATITIKAAELGLPIDGPAVNSVIDDLKRLEHEGYHFEAADASLELLMRRAAGWEQDFFSVESMRVITDEHAERRRSAPRRRSRCGSATSATSTPPRATGR